MWRDEAPSPEPDFHAPDSILTLDYSPAPPDPHPAPEPRAAAPVQPAARMDVDSDDDPLTTPEDSDSGSEVDREVARALTPGPSPKQNEPIARPPSAAKRVRFARTGLAYRSAGESDDDAERDPSIEREKEASNDSSDEQSAAGLSDSDSHPLPNRRRQRTPAKKLSRGFTTSGGGEPDVESSDEKSDGDSDISKKNGKEKKKKKSKKPQSPSTKVEKKQPGAFRFPRRRPISYAHTHYNTVRQSHRKSCTSP